ncbi:MAG: DegV family EDD domain-containing protein [Lachnospiraceae bacterium]|nr:DegV family EDD domain-containing protein [Lachnospiraceae bacterium]
MDNKSFVKSLINVIKDPEWEFSERVYLGLSIISEVVVFVALIGDLIMNENPIENIVLIATLIFVPVVDYIGLKRNKIGLVIKITVLTLIFLILPGLFFFGGGLHGGGVLWFIFGFIYVGLVLTGSWRNVMLVLLVIESLVFYLVNYYYPELIYEHSKEMFYFDSYLSLVMVGTICFAMTWFQNRLYKGENKRARDAADKAEELTRAQNRFFSSMSHEIRTPINSILGLNELILRDPDASDEIIKDANGIQGSGKMLLAIINDILDFSKMEAGGMDIVPVDYRVADMLSELVNMIWHRANEKDLKFNVIVDPDVPAVLYGDEVRIKQVVLNLLNNAVKYTSSGNVELRVESEAKGEDAVELTISVSDTGMGIKKEALPYLFDVFKRVDEEKNHHIEGTGLGLSIVKQLAELMGGTISVSSVYGEGSTFTFSVMQGVSGATKIGEVNIHNQNIADRTKYECSFHAPEARILIVDDNEMNLEVESRLLADSGVTIDKALSGRDALDFSLRYHYDVILMDHLMPEMDGIECMERLRMQSGGLNRNTPVVVLTANAGGENHELYNRAGFDGHLVKPVSGDALEKVMIRFISGEKLIISGSRMIGTNEDIHATSSHSGKMQVIVTCTSMCDIPDSIVRKQGISILPFMIRTEEGIFKDGVQMGSDELIRYINAGKSAESAPPDEAAYTEFFASTLKHAHHLIHIAITTGMSEDYKRSSEAAKAFDNVKVINSGGISSAAGILVLIAQKLVQTGMPVDDIVDELETVKHRLKCSFVIDQTEYMAKRGIISGEMDRMAHALNLHPCIRISDDKVKVGGVWMGDRKRAYRKYISKAFPVDVIPDPEVVFITYVDVSIDMLAWIKEEVSKYAYFERVIFKQASAAISSNCGPGTLGIFYFVKSNKSYNLGSYFVGETVLEDGHGEESFDNGQEQEEHYEEKQDDTEAVIEDADHSDGEKTDETKSSEWYDNIDGIDGSIAIKNSGSEEAFKTVLQIFYDSIDDKSAELTRFYENGDWKNYTIKVHALKSSAKLIGAMELSENARLLEMAGKEDDIAYIKANNTAFLEEYQTYKSLLSPLMKKEDDSDKPVADEYLMQGVYEGLEEAAEAMDCDAMDQIFDELKDYSIPENEKEKYEAVFEKAGQYDYDGVLEVLRKG